MLFQDVDLELTKIACDIYMSGNCDHESRDRIVWILSKENPFAWQCFSLPLIYRLIDHAIEENSWIATKLLIKALAIKEDHQWIT